MFILFLFLFQFIAAEEYSINIDASSYNNWVYYNFTIHSEVVILDPENSLGWDIAFQRNHIKTNSGTSGIGMGGASVDSLNLWNSDSFINLTEVPIGTYFRPDTLLETFYDLTTHTFSWDSTNPNLESWGEFDLENNYTLVVSNNQLIVRTANGNNFIKIWPNNYYSDTGSSGHISVLYSDDVDCYYELDACNVCGGENECDLVGNINGDINNDGNINILDIIALVQVIINAEPVEEYYDINGDSDVDILDIVYMVQFIINA
tara:strand:- start:612 stop:1397 length:786 start_codon:yes stop_codon:yes gene_type:complete